MLEPAGTGTGQLSVEAAQEVSGVLTQAFPEPGNTVAEKTGNKAPSVNKEHSQKETTEDELKALHRNLKTATTLSADDKKMLIRIATNATEGHIDDCGLSREVSVNLKRSFTKLNLFASDYDETVIKFYSGYWAKKKSKK